MAQDSARAQRCRVERTRRERGPGNSDRPLHRRQEKEEEERNKLVSFAH